MRTLLLSLILVFGVVSNSYAFGLQAKVKRTIETSSKTRLVADTEITITDLVYAPYSYEESGIDAYCIYEGKQVVVNAADLVGWLDFTAFENVSDVWLSILLVNEDFFKSIKGSGFQYDKRVSLANSVLEYKDAIRGGRYEDPILENYLYSLLYKILPNNKVLSRPGNLNIMMINSAIANCGVYPDGTIEITTGLMSLLDSEDELVAVLAHEMAHYVLDHSIVNSNMIQKKAERAALWGAIATGVAAIAEGAMAAKATDDYYVPGGLTNATAMISTMIAEDVVKQYGMKFSQEQESEADMCALIILKHLGYNPNALAVALNKLSELTLNDGDISSYFPSSQHPSLNSRITNAGTIVELNDINYKRITSAAATACAIEYYNNGYYPKAYKWTKRNIDNHCAVSEDLIINAMSAQALNNNEQSNQRCIELLNLAEKDSPGNINIYKSKALVYMRLGDKSNAKLLLIKYADMIEQYIDRHKEFISKSEYEYLMGQKSWVGETMLRFSS